MKRVIASILGGILFPIGYTLIVGVISDALPKYNLDTMYVNGNAVPGLLFAPTMLPIYFDFFLRSHNYFGLGLGLSLNNPWFRLTFFILFDIVLYSLLTYWILRRLDWFRAKDH